MGDASEVKLKSHFKACSFHHETFQPILRKQKHPLVVVWMYSNGMINQRASQDLRGHYVRRIRRHLVVISISRYAALTFS